MSRPTAPGPLALLVFLAACATALQAPEIPAPVQTESEQVPVLPTYMPVWIVGTMNLRDGPGTQFETIGSLEAGSRIYIGAPDEAGWSPVYEPSEFTFESTAPMGWVYARSSYIRDTPPE